MKSQAADPQLALLRWSAAWGLALTTMLGWSPLADNEREQLFERLLDDSQWAALEQPAKRKKAANAPKTAQAAKPRAIRPAKPRVAVKRAR
jgi:hypothetical protein